MKKKFNWLGFIALIIWDIGAIQFILLAMNFTNSIFSISNEFNSIRTTYNVYWIILFIILILGNLLICRNNIWMICLGVINLIYYGVSLQFKVSPISIIGCILVILAGVYGLKTNSPTEKIDVNNTNK